MTQHRSDTDARLREGAARPKEEELEKVVKVQGDAGEIELPREEVIPRLDELAEAVLSEKEPPQITTPTEENS